MTQIIFNDRNFGDQAPQPDLFFAPQKYSWNAIGGPKQAKIEAFGPDVDLWRLIELIRAPVVLYSEYAEAVWWGYLAEVRLDVLNTSSIRFQNRNQRIRFGISIDTFSNRIAVAYTGLVEGEDEEWERFTTDWADDDTSQSEYGIKELLWGKDNATLTHAEDARDTKLEQTKYPIPVISKSRARASKAILICRGWWDTLGWQYYANAATDEIATSTQIETMLTDEGQFFTGIDLEIASGKNTNEFRDGDATALFEISQLLEMGTTSDLRMLASVTASRRVIVSEEPANDGSPYFINSDGSWDDKYSNKIRKELCPVGIWARAKDAVPASVDSNYISDPSLAFIEENEYDVINDELNYSARGAPDPWEFPMVKDG